MDGIPEPASRRAAGAGSHRFPAYGRFGNYAGRRRSAATIALGDGYGGDGYGGAGNGVIRGRRPGRGPGQRGGAACSAGSRPAIGRPAIGGTAIGGGTAIRGAGPAAGGDCATSTSRASPRIRSGPGDPVNPPAADSASAVGTGSPTSASPLSPASLWRRWGSLTYEILLLAAVVLIAGFAVLPLLGSPPGADRGAAALHILPPASRALLFVYYVAILGAYCVFFWTRGRRTLPMKTWRLAIRTSAGQPLDARDAVKRYAAAWIGPALGLAMFAWLGRWGLLAGFLNYGWAWIDRRSLFLHDRLAATTIVRID